MKGQGQLQNYNILLKQERKKDLQLRFQSCVMATNFSFVIGLSLCFSFFSHLKVTGSKISKEFRLDNLSNFQKRPLKDFLSNQKSGHLLTRRINFFWNRFQFLQKRFPEKFDFYLFAPDFWKETYFLKNFYFQPQKKMKIVLKGSSWSFSPGL